MAKTREQAQLLISGCKPVLVSSALLVALLVAILATIVLEKPPLPLSADSSPTVFSADRAVRHVRSIAQMPRFPGSRGHASAREYIQRALKSIGLESQVQHTVAVSPQFASAGTIANVVARIDGTSATDEAIALVAHYDSVPAGPGAADDASGVATVLEAARVLMHARKPRNDIILLFTDAEEAPGHLGATAFVAEHPWSKDVRVVLNFEARGTSGLAWLFETTPNNAALIRAVARTVPRPVTSSLAYEVYRRMPNDSDLSVFRASGMAGMNFAFFEGLQHYHTSLDTEASLDRRSLQHQGSYAVALARHFGDIHLDSLVARRSSVFFTLPGGPVFHYSVLVANVLAFLGVLSYLLIARKARSSPDFNGGDFCRGALASVLGIFLSGAAAFAFVAIFGWLHSKWILSGGIMLSDSYFVSLVAMTVAIVGSVQIMLQPRSSWVAVVLGNTAVWLVLLLISTVHFEGVSYLFAVPLFGILISVLLLMSRAPCLVVLACLSVLSVPVVMMMASLDRALFAALGISKSGAVLIAIVTALACVALVPQHALLLQARRRTVPAAMAAMAALAALLGLVQVRDSPESPGRNQILYVFNADENRAAWVGPLQAPDAWSAQFYTSGLRSAVVSELQPAGNLRPALVADAPTASFDAPVVAVIADEIQGTERVLDLDIVSSRSARALSIQATGVDVVAARVDGKPFGRGDHPQRVWRMTYINPPSDGIRLQLRTSTPGVLRLSLLDRTVGLPKIPRHVFQVRSTSFVDHDGGDSTLVYRTYSL